MLTILVEEFIPESYDRYEPDSQWRRESLRRPEGRGGGIISTPFVRYKAHARDILSMIS
jgi:hypothetical protein